MSIGSIGGARPQFSVQGLDPSQIRDQFQQSGLQDQAREKLSSALTSAGIDQETAASLQTDIQAAIQQQFDSGSRDPAAFESALREAFEKKGVDFEATKSRLQDSFGGGPPGGGFSGFGSGLAVGQQQSGGPADLFALLEQFSSDHSSSDSIEFEDPTQNLSETFLDALFGIDEEA